MRVLVACEFSGVVRQAFRDAGHRAWSCDILPCEDGSSYHFQCDVRKKLNDGWDLMIAHPPCTYLAAMSIWWNAKRPERWPLTYAARDFVDELWSSPIEYIALENPIGWLNRNWQKPSQIIHPWQFGHEASKPTCLWLRGLKNLTATKLVAKGEFYVKANGSRMAKWSHKMSGTRKEERSKIASRTFPGIAQAMAQQWGNAVQEVDDNPERTSVTSDREQLDLRLSSF